MCEISQPIQRRYEPSISNLNWDGEIWQAFALFRRIKSDGPFGEWLGYYGDAEGRHSSVRCLTGVVLIVLSRWCWFLILCRLMQKVFGCENVKRYGELQVGFASPRKFCRQLVKALAKMFGYSKQTPRNVNK